MPDMPRLPDRPAHTSQHKHLEPLDGHVERLRRSGRQRKPRLGEKKKVGIEDRTMRSAPWGRVDRLHHTVHDSPICLVPRPRLVFPHPPGSTCIQAGSGIVPCSATSVNTKFSRSEAPPGFPLLVASLAIALGHDRSDLGGRSLRAERAAGVRGLAPPQSDRGVDYARPHPGSVSARSWKSPRVLWTTPTAKSLAC